MIKFPIDLEQMIFLKRLWGELWHKEETPNSYYPVFMVHSCKRDIVFDVQVLFLDALGIGKDLPKYRWQRLAEERYEIIEEVKKQIAAGVKIPIHEVDPYGKILSIDEVRAEQTGEPILASDIKTTEDARKYATDWLKKHGSDFEREVC